MTILAKSRFSATLPQISIERSFGRYGLTIWSGSFCRFDIHQTNHRHVHETYHELCLVVSGSGEFFHGEEQIALSPGTIFFSELNTPHEISSCKTRDLCLVFFNCALHETPAPLSNDPFDSVIHRFLLGHCQSVDKCADLTAYLDILCHEGSRGFDRVRREQTLQLLLIDAFDRLALHKSAPTGGSRQQIDVVSRATSYIEQNCLRQLNITDIAKACACSPRHLRRLFKQKTGHTVLDTVNDRKIALCAQQLLMGFSVTQVAQSLHMESVAQFSRLFKKHNGLAPKAYQQKNAPRTVVPKTRFMPGTVQL